MFQHLLIALARSDLNDAENLPYPDASFDFVMSLIGSMFAPRPELVASEMIRVVAIGAELLLVTRTVDPRTMYEGVDWGLLVFFMGPFILVGGAERAGLTSTLLRPVATWKLVLHVWCNSLRHTSITQAAELGQRAGLGLDNPRAVGIAPSRR